jgi:hypothetical protein
LPVPIVPPREGDSGVVDGNAVPAASGNRRDLPASQGLQRDCLRGCTHHKVPAAKLSLLRPANTPNHAARVQQKRVGNPRADRADPDRLKQPGPCLCIKLWERPGLQLAGVRLLVQQPLKPPMGLVLQLVRLVVNNLINI